MPKSPKFQDPVYRANHRRLHKTRGRAAEHACVRCDIPAAQWAQVHGEDGTDPWADYLPMCVSCHVTYDRGGLPGHPQSPESRAKTSAGRRGWNPSPETRARMSEGHQKRTDLHRDVHGRLYVDKPSSKPAGKLTEDDVREIREILAKGSLSLRATARSYGVGYTTIVNIRNGVTWAWLALSAPRTPLGDHHGR